MAAAKALSGEAEALPGVIPVFPLPGALLLPRAYLPLHIFEPRYLAMVRDAMKNGKYIGMVQPHGLQDDGRPRLFSVGCLGRISQFEETKDGRFLISLKGVSRFRIVSELQVDTPYRQVEADYTLYADDRIPPAPLPSVLRAQLLDQLGQYLEARTLKADWDSIHGADDEMLVSAICMLCPFTEAEKQALLEAASLTERAEAAILLMRFAGEDTGSTDARH
ncbi:LON peptidase substrate-binding domain-containing protein [Pedomonas mirosovicensis]|uniref:LON peptidase substrate-binding domain-containing protein n=1 Tax=Pedomonas mirosovicensis TaxID=2908641 RepID=UPI002168396F|nr:LON peptidase substrate-binding domain-containing protein [Pedomonas mirosovicensis]MCH8684132.1 LON peptidase substrate-binding domain-containing protein [Pedomonas mirosovicensis]